MRISQFFNSQHPIAFYAIITTFFIFRLPISLLLILLMFALEPFSTEAFRRLLSSTAQRQPSPADPFSRSISGLSLLFGSSIRLIPADLRNFWEGFCNGYFSKSTYYLPRRTSVSHLANSHSPSDRNWNFILYTSFSTSYSPFPRLFAHEMHGLKRWQPIRYTSNALVTVDTSDGVARFCLGKPTAKQRIQPKATQKVKKKLSRKAKLNELKWYRLKAKKKMKSPNPEVRIRYKLEKAKRKEEWLIEKLQKLEMPKALEPEHDPEILTEEEKFYLRRTGEKKKNYVPVGRRGVFGGVVLNMHLHWKKHETVKVICKPCRPGQVNEYAKDLTRLSKGTVIDIKRDNTIIFYRGKNYVQPKIMSPLDTLSKHKALDKYKFEQSLDHTSQFIEKLEKELEDYHKHVAMYKIMDPILSKSSTTTKQFSCLF